MEIKPSFPDFRLMAGQGNLIPLCQEFVAGPETPVSVYRKISDPSFSYLLESAEGGGKWSRYSFIGYRPRLTAICRDREMEILEGSHQETIKGVDNPLDILKAIMSRFKPVVIRGLSPFQGGLVGFFNYDLIRKWERLPGISPEDGNLPEAIFTFSNRLIVFDHLSGRIKVIAFAYLSNGISLRDAYAQASHEIQETIAELLKCMTSSPERGPFLLADIRSNLEKEEFEEKVRKAKEHIIAGDVVQVVLSQRFSGRMTGDEFILYEGLRSINPSPYMFYLNFGAIKLIGASPEMLVRLTDGKIELCPIAGTRPRGETPDEDLALERELISDPKERAEHVMLIDLGRNDVGRAAAPGSVTVPRFMEVERFSHVMHLVSRVEGQLRQGTDCFDLFKSVFPAGTVTGAPKIRAMEIISELEPCSRGNYAGAVGYFSFHGNMDFCITIRTITIAGNRLSIQVGAGIVADSVPSSEYEETMKKGAAMFRVIEMGRGNGFTHRQL